MLMPSIFGENLFDDDWMDFPFEREFWGRQNPAYTKNAKNLMKTDIREHDAGYELDIDLPDLRKTRSKLNWRTDTLPFPLRRAQTMTSRIRKVNTSAESVMQVQCREAFM